eukprot:jgi/Tetstr1/424617/TSEL_015139.t1
MRLSLLHAVQDAHKDGIWTTAWASTDDGAAQQLVTGSVDEEVRLWEEKEAGEGVKSLEPVHTFTGHSLGVVSVASVGNLAASSALDSIIRVWDLVTHETKVTIECPPSETWAIDFSPVVSDTHLVAVAGGSSNKVKIWSIEEAAERCVLSMPEKEGTLPVGRPSPETFILSVAISPDGKRLAAGSMDGTVGIFDIGTSTLLHKVTGHSKAVRALDFTPDSTHLLTASDDMHIQLHDTEGGSLIEAFSGHSSWVLDVSCHPNGSCFASGSSDSTVMLWDLSTRTCAQTVAQHSDQVWGVAFRGDGQRLASVSDDRSVAVYDFA